MPQILAIEQIFILFLGFVTSSQTYVITVVSGRLRTIEEEIKALNEGNDLMKWESRIAPDYIFPFFPKVRIKRKNRVIKLPNPIFLAVVSMLIPAQGLFHYSAIKAHFFIPSPWNMIYVIVASVFNVYMIVQSFHFFMFGQLSEEKK